MLVDWPPDTAADLRIRDAQTALRGGRGTRAGACTPAEQARQMAAEVEAALHLGKIALPVLGELEMMVGVCVGGLGVEVDRVDPPARLPGFGFVVADNDRATDRYRATVGGVELGRTIGEQIGQRRRADFAKVEKVPAL